MTIVTEDAILGPPETYVLMHDGLILSSTVLFVVASTSVRLLRPSRNSAANVREKRLAFGQDLRFLASAVLQLSLYLGDKNTQIVLFQIWLICELVAACVTFRGLREASFAEQLRPETLISSVPHFACINALFAWRYLNVPQNWTSTSFSLAMVFVSVIVCLSMASASMYTYWRWFAYTTKQAKEG